MNIQENQREAGQHHFADLNKDKSAAGKTQPPEMPKKGQVCSLSYAESNWMQLKSHQVFS